METFSRESLRGDERHDDVGVTEEVKSFVRYGYGWGPKRVNESRKTETTRRGATIETRRLRTTVVRRE